MVVRSDHQYPHALHDLCWAPHDLSQLSTSLIPRGMITLLTVTRLQIHFRSGQCGRHVTSKPQQTDFVGHLVVLSVSWGVTWNAGWRIECLRPECHIFHTFRALGCQFGAVKLIDRLLWKVMATDGYTFIANFYMFIEQWYLMKKDVWLFLPIPWLRHLEI